MSPNDQPLAGQVALVTGSSRGIGWAVARRLGHLGAQLSLCARHAGPLDEACRRLREQGITAIATAADVTNSDQIKHLIDRTCKEFEKVDILVNNAGCGWFGPVQDASERDWDRVIDTNLKGTFLMIGAVVPGMIQRHAGQIINIASLAGKNSFAGGSIYCASKWGLLGMTYSAAEDLRGHGIRVSVICPGTVLTDFSPHSEKDRKKMLQPDDVAHAVEMIILQRPQSFISEVILRPTEKP